MPYEFGSARAPESVDFGVTGTHRQSPGTWSDDGALMLALLDAMLVDEPGAKDTVVRRRWDSEVHGERALAWWQVGAYTPDPGRPPFDIGNTTRVALHALKTGSPAADAGPADERNCGNGSLMRILPIALVDHDRPDADLADEAMTASRVTHGHPRAQVACALYVLTAARLLAGERDRPVALTDATDALRHCFTGDDDRNAALDHLLAWPDREGRGRVWDSFWSAWDAFAGADSYAAVVRRAVAYGNDTDTTAAIAGGLAGIYWTIDSIPSDWLAGMRGHDVAEPLVDRLLALHGWRTSTTNPIRVAWVEMVQVPRFSAVRKAGGRLGMTFLPGKQRDGWTGLHWRVAVRCARDCDAGADRSRRRMGRETTCVRWDASRTNSETERVRQASPAGSCR